MRIVCALSAVWYLLMDDTWERPRLRLSGSRPLDPSELKGSGLVPAVVTALVRAEGRLRHSRNGGQADLCLMARNALERDMKESAYEARGLKCPAEVAR